MKNYIPSKWNSKVSRNSYTHIRQSRLQDKIIQKRQKSHYILVKETIPPRRCNNLKYICTKHWGNQFHRTNITGHKGQTDTSTIKVCDFNTSLSSTDKSCRAPQNQQRNIKVKLYYEPNGHNRHPQKIPYNNCGNHLLRSLWNHSQNTSYFLGQNTSLYKQQKIEIISHILSKHKIMILEINNKRYIEIE